MRCTTPSPHPNYSDETWAQLQDYHGLFAGWEWARHRDQLAKEMVPHAEALLDEHDTLLGKWYTILSDQIAAGRVCPREYLQALKHIGQPMRMPKGLTRDPGEMLAKQAAINAGNGLEW